MAEKQSIKGKILAIITLGLFVMIVLQFTMVVAGTKVNVQDSITIFAAIVAGPASGIIVGLIGGAHRIYLGDWSSLPSGLATISAGIIGAYLWYKGYRIRNITADKIGKVIILVGLWEVVHTEVYVPLLGAKPLAEGFIIMTTNFMIPMVAVNMLGIGLFLLLCKDAIEARKREEKMEHEIEKWRKVAEALKMYRKVKKRRKDF
ncbi:MAG: LytS/YhcK type 5TM receptor domain-containing protein [Candidatus Aenigmatarchaeota archaeon]